MVTESEVSNWWSTAIIDIHPGQIDIRGYPIEQLIGQLSFGEMIFLMVRGEVPTEPIRSLFEAALVASVDHGPQAPSIATARMAATCGVPFNSVIASAIGLLGDVHGGAGQQCMELFSRIEDALALDPDNADAVVANEVELARSKGHLPGFGHRFHPVDPRTTRLFSLLDERVEDGTIQGNYLDVARRVAEELARQTGKKLPINIDGATATIYLEIGFAPPLGRALFVLSRSVGIISHAWEETNQGTRLKGPMPPQVSPHYIGPERREFKRS